MEPVWLIDEGIWATIKSRNAYWSVVYYQLDGIYHEEIVDNDSFIEPSDMGIGYEFYD